MIKKRRTAQAASKISALARGRKQRREFSIALRAVIRIQSQQRRLVALHKVRKIKDPFYDMTFADCKKLLISEQKRLDQAVKDMNFNLASRIEDYIKSINEAIESKRPLTRAVVDQRIEAVQKELEDAVKNKDFSKCSSLQDKLEDLKKKQSELPTVDELKKAVKAAEAAMAEAAKNRDFSAAAEAQAAIEKSKAKLAEVLSADGQDADEENLDVPNNDVSEYKLRSDLEKDISDLTKQLKEAIDSKDFGLASELQKKLDDKQLLRALFPTAQELKAELIKVKKEVDDAVKQKDFASAASLNEKVAELERKLSAEEAAANSSESSIGIAKVTTSDGKTLEFTSRSKLEEQISSFSAEISKMASEKKFKQAELLQSDIDELVKLRIQLPSVSELQEKLLSKKKEMDAAISSKQFAKADELNSEIEQIEVSLKAEKALQPPSQNVNTLSRDVSKTNVPRATAEPRRNVKAEKVSSKGPVSNRKDALSVNTMPVKMELTPKKTNVASSNASAVSVSASSFRSNKVRGTDGVATPSKPVSKLRPAIPIIKHTDDSVLSAAKAFVSKRGNSCIVVDEQGKLAGIFTDSDLTRRVVAGDRDPASVKLSDVMTPNPTCVAMSDSAAEALTIMVENRFRHLPVTDAKGNIVGLLDIAKCLNNAISKLEKGKDKSSEVESAVREVLEQQGTNAAQVSALQNLLGGVLSQTFGQAMPTLRSILKDNPSATVQPDHSILDTAHLMAPSRKAALVVDENGVFGVFGFKEMARAVSKELSISTTGVSEVVNTDIDTVSPDITVLEALEIMHEEKCLTLPVCESDGRVLGLVDVMDVIYGCNGAEGWRAVIDSAMDIQDDASDASSVNSIPVSQRPSPSVARKQPRLTALDESTVDRPVSKLRPSKPILTSSEDSILEVAQFLASKRAVASLVISSEGNLMGIITDTDMTRRVVAKGVDPSTTNITSVMTADPKSVALTDSAMDALTLMVENHFRHLPVTDTDGSVVGLLDIAKCLNSVISKLELLEKRGNSNAELAVKQLIDEHGSGGAGNEALHVLLGKVMSQAFGNQTAPTLRSLLAHTPKTVVDSSMSVFEASELMAERRKAAIVTDESDQIVGIFGFKDMLMRVVAKELIPELTTVSEVMTPEPEVVSPDITVLEALQLMHDQGFLTLPVAEEDGRVVGLIDVMDLIVGCGGSQGWRAVFSSMMDMTDDISDLGSVKSKGKAEIFRPKQDKTVAKLRPSKPHISECTDSILEVTQLLKSKRGSAALIVNEVGGLAGIITDTDITRRVVAKDVDTKNTLVDQVMTKNPTCVSVSDAAMDALTTMIENHFRHLPVVDGNGSVVGLLDIAKCLNDAISKLELSTERTSSSAEDAVMKVINEHGASDAHAVALQALLGTVMKQAFGTQAAPSLRSLLSGKPNTIVSPDTSIRDAATIMADRRKAALIVDEGRLVGIFGFKDLMNRAVATELPLDTTPISEVMTPDPEAVSPDMNVLEALQIMHDQRFLTLPVCEEDGTVVGLVNIMDVISACGGAEGWRSIFKNSMELEDGSVSTSGMSNRMKSVHSTNRKKDAVVVAPPTTPYISDLPPNIPSTLEFHDHDQISFTGSTIGDERGASRMMSPEDMSASLGASLSGQVMFKVLCPSGTTHRVRCQPRIADLTEAIMSKIEIQKDQMRIEYEDDEGDVVVVTSDHDVAEAFNIARKAGTKLAKLTVRKMETKSKSLPSSTMLIAGGGLTVATIIGAMAFVLFSKRR